MNRCTNDIPTRNIPTRIIKRIPNVKNTYSKIASIPRKQYWHEYNLTYVFLPIHSQKEYYITVINDVLDVSTTTSIWVVE
jgi:hypothetical protein